MTIETRRPKFFINEVYKDKALEFLNKKGAGYFLEGVELFGTNTLTIWFHNENQPSKVQREQIPLREIHVGDSPPYPTNSHDVSSYTCKVCNVPILMNRLYVLKLFGVDKNEYTCMSCTYASKGKEPILLLSEFAAEGEETKPSPSLEKETKNPDDIQVPDTEVDESMFVYVR